MKSERFFWYGILILLYYLGVYMWDQKAEIDYLQKGVKKQKEYMIKREETITEQNELIKIQMQYIHLLEQDYYDPFNKKPPTRKEPI